MSNANHNENADVFVEPPEFGTDFLPVGTTYGQPLCQYKAPCEVRSATDLPSRLYLGTLSAKSFRITDSGWFVRYEDTVPETHVELEFEASRGVLTARFVWRGIEGMITDTPGTDWKSLEQHMSFTFPDLWEDEAKQSIEAEFNARYITHPKNFPVITNFSAGAYKTLVFPVPSYRLHELVDCLDDIEADREIASVVSIYAVLTRAQIQYIRGDCHDVPGTPEALARFNRKIVGLASQGLPRVRPFKTFLRTLDLNRRIYLVHGSCSFRDLTRVIGHFHRQGFIGSPDGHLVPSEYPGGIEWTAMIFPACLEIQDIRLKFTDEQETRWVEYGRLMSPDRLPLVAAVLNVGREEALKKLLDAEAQADSEPDFIRANWNSVDRWVSKLRRKNHAKPLSIYL
ncbi:MAG: hypothetical protein DIZ78_15950 [endosymbiont of Escarpia spicata]|uniref:Uncharacterized protein n=1 Tax=endosymbiont of Escarpia spicata TaxID=2200908 RepID=A0A370DCB3_9GAMM|nr:MAG: hypothetical protein DIZ78_15950 [endosymbiont of Escarpia spicata]